MSRSERLFELLQVLRRHRRPVSGRTLATELDVSIRTLYRDIASLQLQGADIRGEPGVGYVLKPGFMLPPLMFSEEQIEALVLGSRWVAYRADDPLGRAARDAMAKIAAVLPGQLRRSLEATTLLIGPSDPPAADGIDVAIVRKAIRTECKLDMTYRDGQGTASQRIIWPFAIGYFERLRIVVGWCELRRDYRHFRTDRICAAAAMPGRYPRPRLELLREWRTQQDIHRPQD